MDSILTLCARAAQLRSEVDRKREDMRIITNNSLTHGACGDIDTAKAEANHAITLGHEIERIEQRAIEMGQQVVAVEQRIAHLLHDAMIIRLENLHKITYINPDAIRKLDGLTREIHTLRG